MTTEQIAAIQGQLQEIKGEPVRLQVAGTGPCGNCANLVGELLYSALQHPGKAPRWMVRINYQSAFFFHADQVLFIEPKHNYIRIKP